MASFGSSRSAQVKVAFVGYEKADALLAQLPLAVRGQALRTAVRKALVKVAVRATELVPQPGSPGYTPRRGKRKDRKHLRDTIGVAVREYGRAVVGVVGPEYPAGAAGHLVEKGHRLAKHGTGTLKPLADARNKFAPRSNLGPEFRGKGEVKSFVDAKPFMQPAWDELKGGFDADIIEGLQIAIEKHSG